jgi:hypothetical protein
MPGWSGVERDLDSYRCRGGAVGRAGRGPVVSSPSADQHRREARSAGGGPPGASSLSGQWAHQLLLRRGWSTGAATDPGPADDLSPAPGFRAGAAEAPCAGAAETTRSGAAETTRPAPGAAQTTRSATACAGPASGCCSGATAAPCAGATAAPCSGATAAPCSGAACAGPAQAHIARARAEGKLGPAGQCRSCGTEQTTTCRTGPDHAGATPTGSC